MSAEVVPQPPMQEEDFNKLFSSSSSEDERTKGNKQGDSTPPTSASVNSSVVKSN
jgi:hypothetical protein